MIRIKAFEPSDTDLIADILLQESCQRETYQIPFESRASIRDRLLKSTKNDYRLVADLEGVGIVGFISLSLFAGRRNHAGSLALFVHQLHQGKGVGSSLLQEAVQLAEKWLGLKRIELMVYTHNHRAIHLYRKFGFEVEGTCKSWALYDGNLSDAYIMGRVSLGPIINEPTPP